MTDLIKALADAGHRVTRARRAIIETLITTEGHLTADDLAERVQQRAPHVGRMTVYRTLDLLTELGLIRPTYQGTGAAHFVIMEDGGHHHFVCNGCRTVIELDGCAADTLIQHFAQQSGCDVTSHLLELHGLCAACRPSAP